jgi:hypothetical protein
VCLQSPTCLVESAARPLLLINLSETNSPIGFCRAGSALPGLTHAQEARPLFRHNQGSGFHLLGSRLCPEGAFRKLEKSCEWTLRALGGLDFGPAPAGTP